MHILRRNSRIPSFFSPVLGTEMAGITIYPFIFMQKSPGEHPFVYNHELIHIAQNEELLVVGFYIALLLSYIINLVKYRNIFKSYENIPFEREAYACMKNMEYLQSRKLFAWVQFLRTSEEI